MDEKEKNKDKTDEINLEVEKEIKEPDNVTREINLDELYDGAVNNTVVIDPITNDEVLLQNKKPNYTLLGVVLAICVLLILYYVSNKTDLGKTTKDVEPKTTTTSMVLKTQTEEKKTGVLTCNYNAKSDAETQSVSFVANYDNNDLINSKFNYVVISNLGTTTAVIEDLKEQYETFYINNASVIGNNVTFEKNDNGFTFNVETDYNNADFDKIITIDGKTILYVKPSSNDTYESLLNLYTQKGFNCTISSN